MKSKRGLSAIIATLLIILLTLIAVGIIWVVIRQVVQSGGEQVELTTKCVDVTLTGVAVTEEPTSSGNYSVTLRRGSDNKGDIGVKVNVFSGDTTTSGLITFGAVGDLDAGNTVTRTINTTAANVTTVT